MSNLGSALNTFASGASGYSKCVNDDAYNVTNDGVIAAKERSSFLSTVNSIASSSTFIPAGVTSTPSIDLQSVGGVRPTRISTNFMINSGSLAVVNEKADDTSPGQYGFTKVCTFYPDKDGNLVNHAGQYLKVVLTDAQGNPLNPNTSTINNFSTLNISNRIGLPVQTGFIKLYAGLPSNAAIGYAASQNKIIYDAKGNTYTTTITYTKVASVVGDPPNSEHWLMSIGVQTMDTPPANVTVPAAWTNGVDLCFSNGILASVNNGNPVPALTLTPPAAYAVSPFNIAIDPGTVAQANGLTVTAGNQFNNVDPQADGKGPGSYAGLSWDKNGYGVISYTNGQTQMICRIPLATFPSTNSLTEGSNGIFYVSNTSGPYSVHFPEGEIIPSTVEESTVNATGTFINLAKHGKQFQACISGLSKTFEMMNSLERLLDKS